MARNGDMTFDDLDRLLTDLMFAKATVRGGAVTYDHRDSDTFLIIRPHKPAERVDNATLAMVRNALVDRGFLSPKAFEEHLHGAST